VWVPLHGYIIWTSFLSLLLTELSADFVTCSACFVPSTVYGFKVQFLLLTELSADCITCSACVVFCTWPCGPVSSLDYPPADMSHVQLVWVPLYGYIIWTSILFIDRSSADVSRVQLVWFRVRGPVVQLHL
jgi:hypothetical protein